MNEQVQKIFVEDIIPNRFQPRLTFDEKALQELSDSIKVHGVIQPLVLRKVGNKYEIIAGERRYKASCMAGLKQVPAIVREMTDNESAEVALIENVQRKNLSSIEEAQSYKNLLSRGYITQEELANKLGVAQSTISNKLRLLNLCDEVQNALLNEQISERHARSLLQIQNPDDQKKMLDRIIKERLTVKQLDNEIKKLLSGDTSGTPTDTGNIDSNVSTTTTENENNDSSTSSDSEASDTGNGGAVMEPINEETNNEMQGVNQSQKSIFGFSVDTPTDLETSAPNLDMDITAPMPTVAFNPFASSEMVSNIPDMNNNISDIGMAPMVDTSKPPEELETFDMFGDIINPNAGMPTGPINPFGGPVEQPKPKNIGDQISSIRNIVSAVEQAGFRVEMEEYDFEDVYQMNIKIKK